MGNLSSALKKFDVGLSLNEEAINQQLALAWTLWTDAELGAPFRLAVTPLNAAGQPSSTHLDVLLGEPDVLISDEATGSNEVLTRFALSDGSLRYVSDGQPVEIIIKDWTLTFRSRLNRRLVNLDYLRSRDEPTADDLERHFAKRDLSETDFSIECLFLNLTCGEVVDVPQLLLPPGLKLTPETSSKLVQCLITWMSTSEVDGRNGFLLGTSVMPHQRQNKAASFSLSDYTLRLTKTNVPGVKSYHSHSVDYLGVVYGGLAMPASGPVMTEVLGEQLPWMDYKKASGAEGLYSGAMLLRKELFLDLMVKGIGAAFSAESARLKNENNQNPGKHPEWELLDKMTVKREDHLLRISNTAEFNWRNDDVSFGLLKKLNLTITLAPGNTFAVQGELYTYLKRDRATSWDFHSIAHATRTTKIKGSMVLDIQGAGIDALITPTFKLVIEPAVVENRGETSGFIQFLTRINNSWDVNVAGSWLKDSHNAIIDMLKASIDKINVGMDSFACIPPGNGTFTFEEATLTKDMDLMLDVKYVGPTPQIRNASAQVTRHA